MQCRGSDRSRQRSFPILVLAACGTSATSPSPSSRAVDPVASRHRRTGTVRRPRRPRRPHRRATKFKGVNVNILTFNGPQVAEPLQRRAPDWEQLTGGHVNVVAVGFQTIYDKALLDASTGTNSFDALRLQSAVAGRLRRPGLPAGPDGSRQQRPAARLAGHRPVLPRLQRDLQRQGLHDPARRRLPHGLLPQRHARRRTASSRRPRGTTTSRSPQKYNGQDLNGDGQPDYGSCIAKKKGAQSYWWIISIAGRPAPGQGHGRGRVLRHDQHEPAVRPERGHDPGPRDLQEDRRLRPARRAQHGRRRHPRPVHDRPLRPDDGLGRHRHPGPRHLRPGQDRRDDHARLEAGPRPRDRQARPVRRDDLPECGRRRELRAVRLVRRLVGRGQRRPPRRRSRTPPTTSCRT